MQSENLAHVLLFLAGGIWARDYHYWGLMEGLDSCYNKDTATKYVRPSCAYYFCGGQETVWLDRMSIWRERSTCARKLN